MRATFSLALHSLNSTNSSVLHWEIKAATESAKIQIAINVWLKSGKVMHFFYGPHLSLPRVNLAASAQPEVQLIKGQI